MRTFLRDIFAAGTWQRLDQRVATDHRLRWAVIASGTALSAMCYLLAISAAR